MCGTYNLSGSILYLFLHLEMDMQAFAIRAQCAYFVICNMCTYCLLHMSDIHHPPYKCLCMHTICAINVCLFCQYVVIDRAQYVVVAWAVYCDTLAKQSLGATLSSMLPAMELSWYSMAFQSHPMQVDFMAALAKVSPWGAQSVVT